jgi:aryl sulfotransferase
MISHDHIRLAGQRSSGSGGTVWLASFPKSGNTWMRAIVTALGVHPHFFAVNQLGSGHQPYRVGGEFYRSGLDCRWLDSREIDVLRDTQIRRSSPMNGDGDDRGNPRLRKTHEIYRPGEYGREAFPTEATRAALLIVRDPRDVVCSHSPFFGMSIDDSIDALAKQSTAGQASPAGGMTAQPWGSWSQHLASWLDKSVPFPVHLIRYEDLKSDAVGTLLPIFNLIGLTCTESELHSAVEQAAFDRLRDSESQHGFAETSPRTNQFFRKGTSGGWREELTDSQVAMIENDHSHAMELLGYPLVSDDATRATAAEVRASRTRQQGGHWLDLPDYLNISVARGKTPESLPGAKQPRPWISVTPDEALVRFQFGAKLLVTGGRNAIVEWDLSQDASADPSWLVQGWVVTLAMLQRGQLSLHAATVRIGDKTIAVAGHRGAGKSTTSMALRKRGHRLLIDDVTLIEFHDNQAWTTPYPRNVHLLPDAATAVGLDFDALPVLAGGRVKAAFRAEDPPTEPMMIDRIVVLSPGNDEGVHVVPQRGAERLPALMGHTRRDGIAPLVLGQERYFHLLAKLADTTPVSLLRRPREGWTLDEVAGAIESLALAPATSAE